MASFIRIGTIGLLAIGVVAVVKVFVWPEEGRSGRVVSQPVAETTVSPSTSEPAKGTEHASSGHRVTLPQGPEEETPAETTQPERVGRHQSAGPSHVSSAERLDQVPALSRSSESSAASDQMEPKLSVSEPEPPQGQGVRVGTVLGLLFLLLLMGGLIFLGRKGIKVVHQGEAIVVERLGKFHKVEHAGIHWHLPYIDRVKKVVSLQEQMIEISSQESITADKVPVTINGIVFYKVEADKKGEGVRKAVYNIKDLDKAIKQVAQTALRAEISNLDLDAVLSARRRLNSSLLSTLDSATKDWGAKVTRVEISDIDIPEGIKESLNKKNAIIRIAEGELSKTEKQAEAIRVLTEVIGSEKAAEYLLTQDRIEAFARLAETNSANKVVVPYEVMEMVGSLSLVKETVHPHGPLLDARRIRALAQGQTVEAEGMETLSADDDGREDMASVVPDGGQSSEQAQGASKEGETAAAAGGEVSSSQQQSSVPPEKV